MEKPRTPETAPDRRGNRVPRMHHRQQRLQQAQSSNRNALSACVLFASRSQDNPGAGSWGRGLRSPAHEGEGEQQAEEEVVLRRALGQHLQVAGRERLHEPHRDGAGRKGPFGGDACYHRGAHLYPGRASF